MIPKQELLDKIKSTGRVWIRLYNGLIFCLLDTLGPDEFKAKIVPCAKNSREYRVKYSDIKEYVDRE